MGMPSSPGALPGCMRFSASCTSSSAAPGRRLAPLWAVLRTGPPKKSELAETRTRNLRLNPSSQPESDALSIRPRAPLRGPQYHFHLDQFSIALFSLPFFCGLFVPRPSSGAGCHIQERSGFGGGGRGVTASSPPAPGRSRGTLLCPRGLHGGTSLEESSGFFEGRAERAAGLALEVGALAGAAWLALRSGRH